MDNREKSEMVAKMRAQRESLISYLQPYENELNNADRKFISIYVSQVLSKYDAVLLLLANMQTDAIFVLARCFLETYTILLNLIKRYKNDGDYDEYIRRLISTSLEQDKRMYSALGANDATYITHWRYIITTYFSNKSSATDNEIMQSRDEIISENAPFKITSEVKAILENNVFLQDENGMYTDAAFVYGYLCSESHANISAVDIRSTDKETYMVRYNCDYTNLEATIDVLKACLKDIERHFNLYIK